MGLGMKDFKDVVLCVRPDLDKWLCTKLETLLRISCSIRFEVAMFGFVKKVVKRHFLKSLVMIMLPFLWSLFKRL